MRGITLGELKEMIEDLERTEGDEVTEMRVMASHDYGDHCHTEALIDLNRVEVVNAGETAYSDSGLCIRDNDEDENEDDEGKKVVALRWYVGF